MQVKLIVVEGRAREREMVRDLPIVIGRSRAAGVTVGDPKVSRQHCFLEEHGGMVMLRDNGSLNGTLLDGQRVEGEAVIRPGAKLTVGPLTFVVIYEPTGEGVQADTGPMPRAPAAAPDFEALLAGAGDDADEDEAADGDGARDDVPDVPAARPAGDEATQQWLPPPAAASESPALLPPPASPRAPKAEPLRPGAHTEFDWLANPVGDGSAGAGDGASAAGGADETQCAAKEEAAHRDPADAEPPAMKSEGESEEASAAENAEESAGQPETLEPAPATGAAAKKPPKKKRSWWPFGKQNRPSVASGTEPTATTQSGQSAPQLAESPDPDDEPLAAKAPVNEQTATDDTVGPASETLAVSDPSVPSPQQVPTEAGAEEGADGAEQDDDEGDFNQFLKGLR